MFLLLSLTFNSKIFGQVQNSGDQVQTTSSTNSLGFSADIDLFYLCKNGKNTRWLRSHRLGNGKCQTSYSKDGYLQVISSATYFASCEAVLHNVRKNIEEGGYKCTKLDRYSVIEID
jgi:hypothetical protein